MTTRYLEAIKIAVLLISDKEKSLSHGPFGENNYQKTKQIALSVLAMENELQNEYEHAGKSIEKTDEI